MKSLQLLAILRRIKKAVDMVEAQTLQRAAGDQLADQLVHRRERAGVLDPQPGKRADVEEAPVVELGRGQPPMRQPKMLALEQTMQSGPARGRGDMLPGRARSHLHLRLPPAHSSMLSPARA